MAEKKRGSEEDDAYFAGRIAFLWDTHTQYDTSAATDEVNTHYDLPFSRVSGRFTNKNRPKTAQSVTHAEGLRSERSTNHLITIDTLGREDLL